MFIDLRAEGRERETETETERNISGRERETSIGGLPQAARLATEPVTFCVQDDATTKGATCQGSLRSCIAFKNSQKEKTWVI